MALKYKDVFLTLNNIEKTYISTKAADFAKNNTFVKQYALNIIYFYLFELNLFLEDHSSRLTEKIKGKENNGVLYKQIFGRM